MSDDLEDFEFDPSQEEGSPEFTLLPAGKQKAEVIDASIARTKNRKGTQLHLTWQIIEGPYDRRLIFQSIMITHESVEATKFGRHKIKDLCVACGLEERVTDVEMFKHKPCFIFIGVEKDKNEQYPDKNVVRRIKPVIALNAPLPEPPAEKGLNDQIPW
jgi:hypothetical protein